MPPRNNGVENSMNVQSVHVRLSASATRLGRGTTQCTYDETLVHTNFGNVFLGIYFDISVFGQRQGGAGPGWLTERNLPRVVSEIPELP